MPSGIRKSYGSLLAFMGEAFSDFADEVGKSNIPIETISTGDPNAIRNCEAVSSMVKADVFSTLGDCARIWADLRDLNYYNPEHNTVQPVETEVGGKTVQGTPSKKPKRRTDYEAANPKAKSDGTIDLGVGNLDGEFSLDNGGLPGIDGANFGAGGQWQKDQSSSNEPHENISMVGTGVGDNIFKI